MADKLIALCATSGVLVDGQHIDAGEVFEVPEETAGLLRHCGRARLATDADQAAWEARQAAAAAPAPAVKAGA